MLTNPQKGWVSNNGAKARFVVKGCLHFQDFFLVLLDLRQGRLWRSQVEVLP